MTASEKGYGLAAAGALLAGGVGSHLTARHYGKKVKHLEHMLGAAQGDRDRLRKELNDPQEKQAFAIGFIKRAGVAKGLLTGLLGVGDITAESIARQAGKGVRRSVVPVATAGGAVAIVKNKDKKEPEAEKKAEVSKEDLKRTLKKHEERETPAQEKAESAEEQRVEREAGVEKSAFWFGFEKKANLHHNYLHTDGLSDEKFDELMGHVHKVREFRESALQQMAKKHQGKGKEVKIELGPSTNWRDDALHAFTKANPDLKDKVYAGGGATLTGKGKKPGLLHRLLGKKQQDVPNGQAVIVTRLEGPKVVAHTVGKGFGKPSASVKGLAHPASYHWTDLSNPS